MRIVYILATAAAFIMAGSIALDDTTPGSPRSIAVAVAGLLTIIVAALAHAQGTGNQSPA